ncbi:MAG: fumarylacetoacetase [Sphingobium sp.]|nr:fumarylacetoacetase [Sphingobium sp.]
MEPDQEGAAHGQLAASGAGPRKPRKHGDAQLIGLNYSHCPQAKSWVDGSEGHSEFPIQNLPFGIFSPSGSDLPRGGIAIGDFVLDVAAMADLLPPAAGKTARQADAPSLNGLFALGNEAMRALRLALFDLLADAKHEAAVRPHLHAAADCQMHLPFAIGDYTDFYAGIHHAENIGRQFRPENPLLPNYKFVPIGYHGRSSSIRPSGVNVVRPQGQSRGPGMEVPRFGPTGRLDYELEMAVWIGTGNTLGKPISIGKAADHIAGLSLLNDWSARDVQAWEYQPLGPLLSKNFHTTVSPWVVTTCALAPFRMAQPTRPDGDPAPLPYLNDAADQGHGAFSVSIEVAIQTERMRAEGKAAERISKGSMAAMYWTVAQLVTHHTVGGCNLRPGDLLGTGTLSGEDRTSWGSLAELTEGGKMPIQLSNGEKRTFLEDGDEIVMTAHAEQDGCVPIGFGECRARIVRG